jgi:hypothetical protein
MLKNYRSTESHNISGRGLVICVKINSTEQLPYKNEIVQIDGDLYKVTGCETSIRLSYPPVRESGVGLLVQKIAVEVNTNAMDRVS